MKRLRNRIRPDERGAVLVLAIAFMIIAATIGASLVTTISTTSFDRVTLDQARNREYTADAGIESAISQVRTKTTAPGIGFAACGGPYSPPTLNGVSGIRVDCLNAPQLTQSGFLQRDVVFIACISGSPCTAANTIIRAEVNFEAITLPSGNLSVTDTTVLSWSVNQ